MELKRFKQRRLTALLVSGLGLMLAVSTGCQAPKSAQPSCSTMCVDDVQYFPKGPEFDLPREAGVQESQSLGQEHTEQGKVGKASVR